MRNWLFFVRIVGCGGLAALGSASTLGACGARTELQVPPPPADAAFDAGADARLDVRFDARRDADAETETATDVEFDVPVIDECPDAGATLIYLFTEANELLSFYPPDVRLRTIGTLSCPLDTPSATPFSMAVDRRGLAYVLYNDGELFKVSTKDARCAATSFAAIDPLFTTFGMGFTANTGGDAGETLYVLGYPPSGARSAELGTIDVKTFDLRHVGPLTPTMPANGELTGSGDGRLFSYAPNGVGTATFLEIDPKTARVISAKPIGVPPGSAWAFAFWGGDFYLFNAPTPDHSNVTRYRPADDSAVTITSYPNLIVGAGVSTCAPTGEP